MHFAPQCRVVVGYSGGLDSTVLLQGAARLIEDRRRLFAVHVNHGLSPNAEAWQRHCESVSEQLNVDFVATRVNVPAGASLEASARRARYDAFREVIGVDDVLWLGHHLDDQAETVLWRLLRGGGASALSAMPASRRLGPGWLLRPLLDVAHSELASWAQSRGLQWIDDESNLDRHFDRNFVRHELLPVLRRRWPDAAGRLHQAAKRFAVEAALMQRTLDAQLDAAGAAADRVPLMVVDEPQAGALLRRWLERAGIHGVRERVVAEIVRQSHGASDRAPAVVVAPGYSVRRYAHELHLVIDRPHERQTVRWRLGDPLETPVGLLVAHRGGGGGLRASLDRVEVRVRGGGERLRLAGRDGSRRVKRLLQEANVPPWLRDAYPLIYVDDRLVAVPGIAVDTDFADNSQDAWHLTLRARGPHARRLTTNPGFVCTAATLLLP